MSLFGGHRGNSAGLFLCSDESACPRQFCCHAFSATLQEQVEAGAVAVPQPDQLASPGGCLARFPSKPFHGWAPVLLFLVLHRWGRTSPRWPLASNETSRGLDIKMRKPTQQFPCLSGWEGGEQPCVPVTCRVRADPCRKGSACECPSWERKATQSSVMAPHLLAGSEKNRGRPSSSPPCKCGGEKAARGGRQNEEGAGAPSLQGQGEIDLPWLLGH